MSFYSIESGQRRTLLQLRFWLAVGLLLTAVQLNAAEHFVPSSTSTVDCRNYGGGIKAGDTITLAAGNRGPLTIRNCSGNAGDPIVVQNDTKASGPTVIRRQSASSGGFIFSCTDCVHVVIDGLGKWSGAPQGAYCGAPAGTNGCGIKVTTTATNDSPTSFMRLNGFTTKITVRGVEIDGRMAQLNTKGVGIHQNDKSILALEHPGFWREDITYEQNFIHNVYGEGMYLGPNWRGSDRGAPLRNITVRKNLVENTGRQNIQLKSAIGGSNRIHDNVVRRSGLRSESGQGAGISVFEGGSNVKIYNNWVEASGIQGIQHYNMYIPSSEGPFKSEIFNNVVYDSGKSDAAGSSGYGITVARGSDTAVITTVVYNNTIVKTSENGVNFGSRITNSVVRDNIIVASGSSALSVGGNAATNNRTGTISAMKFVDAQRLDFALASDSPARDAGSSSGFPPDDFMGVKRPQGRVADQGAFEFTAGVAPPKAPALPVVN